MVSLADPSRWPLASQRQVSAWRKLSTKRGRAQAGEILVEGVRLVGEALQSQMTVSALLMRDDPQGQGAIANLRSTLSHGQESLLRVRARDFGRLTDTVHAAGVAAVVQWTPAQFDPESKVGAAARRVLICDRISDPGNLGTLIRSAVGLGVEMIFTHPAAVALTNPKTVRATAGALFRVPIFEDVAVALVADWCSHRRLSILIADAHQGHHLQNAPRPRSWALVVGGETLPLDPVWDKVAVRRVRLPLKHGVESLNAGVAGAILIDRLCRKVDD